MANAIRFLFWNSWVHELGLGLGQVSKLKNGILAKTQRLIAAPLRSSAQTFAPSSADAFETVNIDVDQLVVLEQRFNLRPAAAGEQSEKGSGRESWNNLRTGETLGSRTGDIGVRSNISRESGAPRGF